MAGWLAALLLVSACSPQATTERQSLKLAYLPVVHGLPLYVAQERGYFAEEGLQVELVKFEAPNQLIDAVLTGQVPMSGPGAAAGITAVSQAKNPGSLWVYGLSGASSMDQGTRTEALLVGNDSDVQTVTDLRGRSLGVLPGIQWRTIAQHFLAQHGLSVVAGDVTLVELAVPLQAQALATGQVDALLAIEPVPTVVTQKGMGRIVVESPMLTDVADPFYPGAGVINASFAAEQPETVAKVQRAIRRAMADIVRDPASTRTALVGYTPLDADLASVVPLLTWKMHDELTPADRAGYQAFVDIFVAAGVIAAPLDVQTLFLSHDVR
jgi:NitT/TauT family transport system substrate-binding protein